MNAKDLSHLLIQTVVDPDQWQAALEELCRFTDVPKALLTLRDYETADIVVPEAVSSTFSSPLISGFTDEEVASYLSLFLPDDPWTPIERQNFPLSPYQMSRYLPKAELRKTTFWNWLAPQGLDDCVVCEIGQMDNYWAALNLYFDGSDRTKAEDVIQRLKSVLPELRTAWHAGRRHQIAATSEDMLELVLSALPAAALLIDRSGVVFAANQDCKDIFAEVGEPLTTARALRLPANIPLTIATGLTTTKIGRGKATARNLQASAKIFQSAELAGGELRDLILVTITPVSAAAPPPTAPIWTREGLTPREQMLVRLVAQGHKFSEAQADMGVSYQRVMQLWKSARQKLKIADVTELRLVHRLSQS